MPVTRDNVIIVLALEELLNKTDWEETFHEIGDLLTKIKNSPNFNFHELDYQEQDYLLNSLQNSTDVNANELFIKLSELSHINQEFRIISLALEHLNPWRSDDILAVKFILENFDDFQDNFIKYSDYHRNLILRALSDLKLFYNSGEIVVESNEILIINSVFESYEEMECWRPFNSLGN